MDKSPRLSQISVPYSIRWLLHGLKLQSNSIIIWLFEWNRNIHSNIDACSLFVCNYFFNLLLLLGEYTIQTYFKELQRNDFQIILIQSFRMSHFIFNLAVLEQVYRLKSGQKRSDGHPTLNLTPKLTLWFTAQNYPSPIFSRRSQSTPNFWGLVTFLRSYSYYLQLWYFDHTVKVICY